MKRSAAGTLVVLLFLIQSNAAGALTSTSASASASASTVTSTSTSTSAYARPLPCLRTLAVLLNDSNELPRGSPSPRIAEPRRNELVYPSNLRWAEKNKTYGCPCNLTACVRRCCAADLALNASDCVEIRNKNDGRPTKLSIRPQDSQLVPELRRFSTIEDAFYIVDGMECNSGNLRYLLDPLNYPEEDFLLQRNGTLSTTIGLLGQENYCFAWSVETSGTAVVVCGEEEELVEEDLGMDINKSIVHPIGIGISVFFILLTFLVYALVPELRNLHGKILMCYMGSLMIAYTVLLTVQLDREGKMNVTACTILAFIIHFSFLASFFWLNVMCFDIWWTFGGFRSLQGSAKQRERKKFIMYSIYAWGSATILTGICVIMDFVPSVPKSFIRPQFGSSRCWFTTENAKAIYFYGPVGITVLCNICLFISTALKIIHHKKDTAHHLKGSESRRHDDNKQWFNLYLKLFIVMGINWSMEIVSWVCKGCPAYLWYITDLANTLQGIIIFIIFVWKDKIKRLLLKRFGCHDRSVLSRNSTRSAYHSSTSRTCTTAAPLQEKVNPYVHESYRTRPATTDDSDCA